MEYLLDTVVQDFADKNDLPAGQLKLFVVLLLNYPLCILFRFVPRQLTHFVSITLGVYLQYSIYKEKFLFLVALTVINYVILKTKVRNATLIVVCLTFIVLFYLHIYRQITCYGCYTIDMSTMIMITTVKFQTISYCISDGQKPRELLSEYQKKHKIDQMPSFLEFFSYIYFFPQAVCGPACEFIDFQQFMNRENRYRNIPNGYGESFKHFCITIFCLFLYFGVFPNFHPEALLDTKDMSIPYMMIYINISSMLMRSKYYLVWSLLQSQHVLIGFSYSDNNEWNTCRIAKIEGEILVHPREKMEHWNCQIQNWLKNYIYFRIYSEEEMKKSRTKQDFANNVTFMFSALWHGFYPGYFIAFFNWSLVSILAKYCFKASLNYPNFNYNNILYKIARGFISLSLMNYFGIVFLLLDFQTCWTFFVQTYFCFGIVLYLGILFFLITGLDKPKKKKE